MSRSIKQHARGWLTPILFACIAWADAGIAQSAVTDVDQGAALRVRYAALGDKLANSQFQRPLFLDSAESSTTVRGDVFALVDYPFADVNAVFNGPARWCDVLILHINTKYCATATNAAGTVLTLNIGKKTDEPLVDTSRVDFDYRVRAARADYLEVELHADKGPLSTSNCLILLEATAAEGGRTIVHLTYSYAYGFAGRVAMQIYLATAGRGKVGFTLAGTRPDGQTDYIGGVRAVVERNTMRYFLAIDAYLGALTAPAPARLETRLQSWYDTSENYARQLHDVDRNAYLEMKRREYQRQQAALK